MKELCPSLKEKRKISEINKVEKEFREKQQSLQKELQTKQNSELTRIRLMERLLLTMSMQRIMTMISF